MAIVVDNPSEVFGKHFAEDDNKRIFFSGRYGSGKSTFLKDYFKDRSNNTFWISPIKYVVGTNEDIFEYIKFDLAFQFLKHPDIISRFHHDIKEDNLFYAYLKTKPLEVIKILSKVVGSFSSTLETVFVAEPLSKVVKPITETVISFVDQYEKYETFKKEINKSMESNEEKVKLYLNNIVSLKGSIYEEDDITKILQLAIRIIKEQTGQIVTLVIDDLDRIDPEHIFRILNILSVHNDYHFSNNKFDFDKIIIVCHYENIQKSFEHKYGLDVDFEGYIDKFYSKDVFRFSSSLAVKYHFERNPIKIFKENNLNVLLRLCLIYFVGHDILTMRNIIKLNTHLEETERIDSKGFVIGPFKYSIQFNTTQEIYAGESRLITNTFSENLEHFNLNSTDFSVLQILRILVSMFGDYTRLFKVIQKLSVDAVGSINAEDLPALIRSFILTSHLVNSIKNPSKLLYNKSSQRYSGGPLITFPEIKFPLGISRRTDLPLVWKSDNLYDGTKSYYHGMSDYISTMNVVRDGPIQTDIGIKNIFAELYNILKFLEENNYLNNLIITK